MLPSMRNIRLCVCFPCTPGIALCPNFSRAWHVMKKHRRNHSSEMEDKNACRTPQAWKKWRTPTGMQVLNDIWKHWATFRLGYTWNSVSKFKLHKAMAGSQSDDAGKTEPGFITVTVANDLTGHLSRQDTWGQRLIFVVRRSRQAHLRFKLSTTSSAEQ